MMSFTPPVISTLFIIIPAGALSSEPGGPALGAHEHAKGSGMACTRGRETGTSTLAPQYTRPREKNRNARIKAAAAIPTVTGLLIPAS